MTRRGVSLAVSAFVVVALVIVGAILSVPYVVYLPGPTTNTLGDYEGAPLIAISGRQTFPTTGELNLTTVSLGDRLTLPRALRYWWDGDTDVVPRDVVYPPGESKQAVQQQDTQEMLQSQETATTAALRQLGIPVRSQVSVADVTAGSPANGVLQVGDVITAVEGTPITSADQLRNIISARPPGQPVTVSYTRDGRTATATITTTAATGQDGKPRPVIGVVPKENNDYPFKVDIRLERVGGPSAGLIFALGIIDRLTPGDLTGGKDIAGTGTISADGTVGPIGGIHQKLVGARQEGATVFLVPAENCAEAARNPPDGLRLVKVTNLADALANLRQLATPGGPAPAGCR